MIDLEHHFGRGESFVGYDELMRIMEADKVAVEEGDLRLLPHRLRPRHPRHEQEPRRDVLAANPCAGLDGRDERLLNWITTARAPSP